ncbi:MAG: helix-turn-helix domain-containing protein [Acholeplasmataceae bacterium]
MRKTEKTYTVDEVMEMLSVNRVTIYKWIRSGELRAVRIGRQFRIPKDYYDEFIESNTIDNSDKNRNKRKF